MLTDGKERTNKFKKKLKKDKQQLHIWIFKETVTTKETCTNEATWLLKLSVCGIFPQRCGENSCQRKEAH